MPSRRGVHSTRRSALRMRIYACTTMCLVCGVIMLTHVRLANNAIHSRTSATVDAHDGLGDRLSPKTGQLRRGKLQDREQKKIHSLSRKRRGGGYSACNDDRLFVAIQSELSENGSVRRDGTRSTWLRWTEDLHENVDYRFFVTQKSMNGARIDNDDVEINLEREIELYGDVVVRLHEQLQPRSSWNDELWSLQWTQSSEFQNFSVFLTVRDDSLLCVHRVVEELAQRPDHRFVWGRYSCSQQAPSIDSKPSDNVNGAHPQLNKGFLAFTRDVATFLRRLHHVPLELDTLFPLLELTILDDQKRLVDEQRARLWLEGVSTSSKYGPARGKKFNFCQRFVWAEALADKTWSNPSAHREQVRQETARAESASLVKYDAIEKLVSRFWRSYQSSAIKRNGNSSATRRDNNATVRSNWTNITADATTHAANGPEKASVVISNNSEVFGNELDRRPEIHRIPKSGNATNKSGHINARWAALPAMPALRDERLAPSRNFMSPILQSDEATNRGLKTRNRFTVPRGGNRQTSPQSHIYSKEPEYPHEVRIENRNRMSRGISLHEHSGVAYSQPYNDIVTPQPMGISLNASSYGHRETGRTLGKDRHRRIQGHAGRMLPLGQARQIHHPSRMTVDSTSSKSAQSTTSTPGLGMPALRGKRVSNHSRSVVPRARRLYSNDRSDEEHTDTLSFSGDLRETLFRTMGLEGRPSFSFNVRRADYAVLTPICGAPPATSFRATPASERDAVSARARQSARVRQVSIPRLLKKQFVTTFLDEFEERNLENEQERVEVSAQLHSCSFDIDCLLSTIRERIVQTWWRDIDVNWATKCRPATVSTISKCGKFRERKFRNGSSDAAALASFPGSGNTWSRMLLEFGSGVFTGSIYDDIDLMRLLPAEGAEGSAVLAVKAHVHPSKYIFRTGAKRVLLLVRHPFDAIWAEYQRRHGGGHASVVELSSGTVNSFGAFAECMACKWLRYTMIHANIALTSSAHKLLVIRFEDLSRNTSDTLRRMLRFLGVQFPRQKRKT